MDLDNLKAFIAVAETGSFSVAAEKLFITQPAVSKRVASLEHSLDTRLFDRIGHTISLTEAGKALLPRAHRILLEVEDSKRAVANLTETVSGTLTIGTSHHIGLHRLPPVLRQFIRAYPDVQLDIEFMDSEDACNAVVHGDLELGIVTLPLSPDPDLKITPIWKDPLVLVANKEHPLTHRKRVSIEMLAEHGAILPATGTFTREVLERSLKPFDLKLNVTMSTNYLETILMLVSVGLGWSVLPRSMINKDIREIPVKGISLERTLGIVTHVERTLSNAAKALMGVLDRETCKQ